VNGMKGVWAWLGQRVSGVVLVFLLGIHLWVLHFVDPGAGVVFQGVAIRLRSVFFIVVDLALLAFSLYHGLNGLRTVILDYSISEKAARKLTWVLTAVGVAAFVYGALGLMAFLSV